MTQIAVRRRKLLLLSLLAGFRFLERPVRRSRCALGPQGESLARAGLERAWPRYPALRQMLSSGAAALGPNPLPLLEKVAQHLAIQSRPRIRLIPFVGQFDGGAFSYRADVAVVDTLG